MTIRVSSFEVSTKSFWGYSGNSVGFTFHILKLIFFWSRVFCYFLVSTKAFLQCFWILVFPYLSSMFFSGWLVLTSKEETINSTLFSAEFLHWWFCFIHFSVYAKDLKLDRLSINIVVFYSRIYMTLVTFHVFLTIACCCDLLRVGH